MTSIQSKTQVFLSDNTLFLTICFSYVISMWALNWFGVDIGFMRDEYYYIACSKHLAWGYTDHPPLIELIAFVSRQLFNESMFAYRFIPPLFGAASIWLMLECCKLLGGKTLAQFISVTSLLTAPTALNLFRQLHLNGIDFFGILLFQYFLLRFLIQRKKNFLIYIGIALGIACLNRYSIIYVSFFTAIALILSPFRVLFYRKETLIGFFIAFLIIFPNLLWQYQHNFDFYTYLQTVNTVEKHTAYSTIAYLLVAFNPFNFLLTCCFLFALFEKNNNFNVNIIKLFSLAFLFINIFIITINIRPFYLLCVYPLAIVIGAIVLEKKIKNNILIVLFLFFSTVSGISLSIPALGILSTSNTVKWIDKCFSFDTNMAEYIKQILIGYKTVNIAAQQIATIYDQLPLQIKKQTVVWISGYGRAAAFEYEYQQTHLNTSESPPLAICHNNAYWHWGVIESPYYLTIGLPTPYMNMIFEEYQKVGKIDYQYAVNVDTNSVFLAKGLKISADSIWKYSKSY